MTDTNMARSGLAVVQCGALIDMGHKGAGGVGQGCV